MTRSKTDSMTKIPEYLNSFTRGDNCYQLWAQETKVLIRKCLSSSSLWTGLSAPSPPPPPCSASFAEFPAEKLHCPEMVKFPRAFQNSAHPDPLAVSLASPFPHCVFCALHQLPGIPYLKSYPPCLPQISPNKIIPIFNISVNVPTIKRLLLITLPTKPDVVSPHLEHFSHLFRSAVLKFWHQNHLES